MRPFGSLTILEGRRPIALLAQGFSLREVARRVWASVGSISQCAGRGGREARRPWPPSQLLAGRAGCLTSSAPTWSNSCCRGPRAIGSQTSYGPYGVSRRWSRCIVERYYPARIWKLLHRLGWRGQVPERQAIRHDEPAITHWKRYTWPAIKKSLTTWKVLRLPG
jgi:transposase